MQGYIVMCTHIVSLTLLVPSPGLLVVGNLPDVVLVKREHAVTTLHSTGHCTRSAGQQWNSWIRALDTEQYQLMVTTLPQLFIGEITENLTESTEHLRRSVGDGTGRAGQQWNSWLRVDISRARLASLTAPRTDWAAPPPLVLLLPRFSQLLLSGLKNEKFDLRNYIKGTLSRFPNFSKRRLEIKGLIFSIFITPTFVMLFIIRYFGEILNLGKICIS